MVRTVEVTKSGMISALFVETDGCYFGSSEIDPWDLPRDAMLYGGPYPVVAHPPCQRWGRFWHGSTAKPHQYKLGDDGGTFKSALESVRTWGGVLEHPADSQAWKWFNINRPKRFKGWFATDCGGWTAYVEQGHYGHFSRKPTWLYVHGVDRERLPELDWSKGAQRLPQIILERHGYEKARRCGMCALIGGKDKTKIRNATPEAFKDVLLDIARQVYGKVGVE